MHMPRPKDAEASMHHTMQEGQCSALPSTCLGNSHKLLHAGGAAAYAVMCGSQANLLTMPDQATKIRAGT